MVERDGKFYERRHQIGFAGKETNEVEKQIDFVIGSGNHARTYAHRSSEGDLVELPVSWYSEKGGYWAMSPGYDNPTQDDFRRPVADDCLFCHNGYPGPGGRIAEGIDCQRCHGPGRAHVKAPGNRANIVESRPAWPRTAARRLHAMPSGDHQSAAAQCNPEVRSRAVLIPAWGAAGRLRTLLRSRRGIELRRPV